MKGPGKLQEIPGSECGQIGQFLALMPGFLTRKSGHMDPKVWFGPFGQGRIWTWAGRAWLMAELITASVAITETTSGNQRSPR